MKLKSELYETRDGGKDVYWNRESEVEHDAMAAHAYKQAIADWHEKNGTGPDEDAYPESAVAFIEQRAAEILAGWLGEERG